ncbi:hypothetical protein ACPPVV_03100 [Rhodanobacter sp. Col0626]|uniref:hypothetical protein n=1 Tax=Rhodanobacter sp. Col0626 TaxID=3415679 RepID=UPI003CE8DC76
MSDLPQWVPDASIGAWIASASPVPLGSLGIGASINGIKSDSMIAGPQAEAALAADRCVVKASASGADAEWVAAFRLSPLTGCTSVLSRALAQSTWNPLANMGGEYLAFQLYLDRLNAMQFFDGPPARSESAVNLLDYRNSDAMAKAIASLLPDMDVRDRNRVTRSIMTMAHSVFDGGDGSYSGSATMFTQHVLAVAETHVQAHLHWCQAVMRYDREKKKNVVHESRQSRFVVQRFTFTLSMDRWAAKADEVARQKITDVETWLASTSRLRQ